MHGSGGADSANYRPRLIITTSATDGAIIGDQAMTSKTANTLQYFGKCREIRQQARDMGIDQDQVFLNQMGLTRNPTWLVNMAINRRAGWPDDPSLSRGSAMPVNGRFPKKGGGDWYNHLRLLSHNINSRVIVRETELGEHRWLMNRIPERFHTAEDF